MFIVFEGPKFTGRGLIVDRLYQDLHNKYKVYFTKEPGGTDCGKEIRKLLNNDDIEINKTCEVLLEAADRAQHCEKILALMDKGYTVISEGFKESSFVYSGYMKGLNTLTYNLNHVATRGLNQDLTVLVICNPEEAYKRRKNDKMAKKDYIKSYEGYMELYYEAKTSNDNWLLIDTSGLNADESYELFLEKFKPYMINLTKEND